MRIVIDMQGAQTESRFRGIGRYTMSLTKEITRQAGSHDIWLVLNERFPDAADAIKSEFKGLIPERHILTFNIPVSVSNRPDNIWRIRTAELLREAFIANLNPDIVYVTSLFEGWGDEAVVSIGSLETVGKTAVTLYDLIPFLNQETYLTDQISQDYYFYKIKSLKKANLLLSISEYARQEGINSLNLPPERVVNISTAANAIFRPIHFNSHEKKSLFKRYGITKPFIMYTGSFDPRKNLSRMLEAFSLLPAAILNNHQLLIAGKASQDVQYQLRAQSKKFGIINHVIIADYVPDEDLVALYNTTALFVLPSLHEGFGLPALEAMACGAPVIGSNTTSIPEVIGCKDALFDPTKVKFIAERIVKVLNDEGLRNFLCEHGLEQSKNFCWKISARRVLDAFENIVPQSVTDRLSFIPVNKNHHNKLIDSIASIISQDWVRATDQDLIDIARSIWDNEKTVDQALRACLLGKKIRWRLEGSFHDSYSLSLLNRETARALTALGHEVALWSSNNPGFYLPPKNALLTYLSSNPDIARMYEYANQLAQKDANVVSRNIYPPYVSDMRGRINLLHHYAWEESGFPAEWVNNFNESLQGITCLSTFVEKVLIDNGVNIPLSTSGCGVDHWERVEPDTSFHINARGFRFLHVSSCFPRKGADILLDAYGSVFNDSEDVSLIIKTFNNPHNQIHEWLAERKKKNRYFPHVIIIEDELTDSQLKSLYQQCHVLVGPSRGEGFGLPFAEAMLSGLPVITTGWGGQMDFCNDETAWLVDYKFEQAQTHFNLFDSVWAEPDVNDLADKMREVYTSSAEERKKRMEAGRLFLLNYFRWVDVVGRAVQSTRDWASMPMEPQPKIGWITTWNTKCGIASYSKHLLCNILGKVSLLAAHTDLLITQDDKFVTRCWTQDVYGQRKDDLSELSRIIEEQGIDTLFVQFNYGFFDFQILNTFLTKHLDAGRVVIFVFHSTTDPESQPQKQLKILLSVLQRCQRLLVHSINDLNHLKSMGLIDNVTLFPHGIIKYAPAPRVNNKEKLIASYGFFLPPKGLLELIDAFAVMIESGEKVKLLMVNSEYPHPISATLIKQAYVKIEQLKIAKYVKLITEYLPDQESLDLLSQADLIVFPYQQSGESSSAAVRYGLATGRPIAVTPLPIFDDVSSAVFKLPGFSPLQISQGIIQILHEIEKNSENVQRINKIANQWRSTHFYAHLSTRLYAMIQALYRKQGSCRTTSFKMKANEYFVEKL